MQRRQLVAAVLGGVACLAGLGALAWLRTGPDRAAIPAGETWWCYATPRGAGCARTGPECVAQLSLRAATGLETCATQPAAWCFTTTVSEASTGRRLATNWQCLPTREACEALVPAGAALVRCAAVE